MRRTTLWALLTVIFAMYSVAKVALGFQAVRNSLDAFLTAEYWTAATLFLQWLSSKQQFRADAG